MAYLKWRALKRWGTIAGAGPPLAAGLVAGLITALPPVHLLYPAWSANLGIDSGRLQLIAAAGLAVLLTALWAIAQRSFGPSLLAGTGAVLAGVVAPSALMAYNDAAPQGLTQTTDWTRLVLNPLSLGGAALLLAALVPAAIVLAAQLRRLDARGLLLPVAVVGSLPISAAAAEPLIRYGPAYSVHHISAVQASQPLLAGAPSPRVAPHCLGASAVRKIQVKSQVLGQQRDVAVQLPAGYPGCAPRGGYTVLYLLHGDPGTYADWVGVGGKDLIDASVAGGAGPLVVVYPDGNGPRWTDWADTANWHIGTFISAELVSYIDSHYHTSPHRDQRYIAGLSSGGFGAASLAMSHPQVFGGFASYSGYFNVGTHGNAHGVPTSASPDLLVTSLGPNAVHVFIGSGDADGTYTTEARRFRSRLQASGWEVDYSEGGGGHSWALWRSFLWQSLPLVHQWASFHTAPKNRHQLAALAAPTGHRL